MILPLLYGVLLSFKPLIHAHLFHLYALIQFLRSIKKALNNFYKLKSGHINYLSPIGDIQPYFIVLN